MYRRKEDEADKWLREHDPYYTTKDRWKKKKGAYYETPEQEHRRYSIEIPFSSLSKKQKSDIPEAINIFE